ncbi:hypothetical protein ABIB40_003459 [Pedobacter sp. UYP30]|uniref:hypothetical protein n=1 Tax=Pedobacter sp. UYP30 TaxID=1756400 RepID=UPI003398E756
MEIPKPILIDLKENISKKLEITRNSLLAEKRKMLYLKELCLKCEYYEMVAKLREIEKKLNITIAEIDL